MIIRVTEDFDDKIHVDEDALYDEIRRTIKSYMKIEFKDFYRDYMYETLKEFISDKAQVILDDKYAEIVNNKIELLFLKIKAQEKMALEIVENEVKDMQQRMDALYYMMQDLQKSNHG